MTNDSSLLSQFSKGINGLNDFIGRLVSWLALGMVLVGAWNTVARFLDREIGTELSSNTWLETGWYMFAALFLFGAAWTLRKNAHVRVDIFYSRLTERGKTWTDLLGSLLLLIPFCLFMIWAVWPSVVDSWEIKEMSPDPGGLPRWPIRMAVLLAFVLLLLQGIATMLKGISLLSHNGRVVEEKVG
ncbi:MAG: TRAP transporter small permease subunit [Chlorobi bacterium]|nr:TRAP transporter small permease subunit [Chlorobiota bacterium]